MAPIPSLHDVSSGLTGRAPNAEFGDWREGGDRESFIVEGWGEGFIVGALLIMSVITVANMRRGVLLHKLILIELLFALSHGTFCFMAFDGYGWYLSSTAALLYCSYFTHNVVAWLKIKPFFTGSHASFGPKASKWITRVFLGTLTLTFPVLVFQIFNNFRYFNQINSLYEDVRPYESLLRDPWWIFTCLTFFHVIRKVYSLNAFKLIKKSPRFGILLAAMFLAIIFTIMDILSSTVDGLSLTDGINPYWKLALVFKCLTDNIMLDDFKSVLQRLGAVKLDGSQQAMMPNSLNMAPNEKAGEIRDDADEMADDLESPSSRTRFNRRSPRISLSGRGLDDGEELDEHGRSRRRQSMAGSAVGRIGQRARNLPGFGFLMKSAQREAKKNMERNKKIPTTLDDDVERESGHNRLSPDYRPSAGLGRPSAEPEFGRTPTEAQSHESFDFITSALDTHHTTGSTPW